MLNDLLIAKCESRHTKPWLRVNCSLVFWGATRVLQRLGISYVMPYAFCNFCNLKEFIPSHNAGILSAQQDRWCLFNYSTWERSLLVDLTTTTKKGIKLQSQTGPECNWKCTRIIWDSVMQNSLAARLPMEKQWCRKLSSLHTGRDLRLPHESSSWKLLRAKPPRNVCPSPSFFASSTDRSGSEVETEFCKLRLRWNVRTSRLMLFVHNWSQLVCYHNALLHLSCWGTTILVHIQDWISSIKQH